MRRRLPRQRRFALEGVLVYHAETDDFSIDAGVGWAPGVIGMRVPAHLRSVPGRAFKTGESMIARDFVDRSGGSVSVTLIAGSAHDPMCTLMLADDGRGMGPLRQGSQGLEIIGSLANRLHATLQVDETPGTGGTRYRLRFAPARVDGGNASAAHSA